MSKTSSLSSSSQHTLEEYLRNASISLEITLTQLRYASEWLKKYRAESTDIDVLRGVLAVHFQELQELVERYDEP